MSSSNKHQKKEQGMSQQNESDLARIELDPILKKLKPEERKAILLSIQKHHSGPLPSPETLAEYERVNPGLAQIIVDAFQAETAHRHSIDNKIVDAKIKFTGRGQNFGLLIFFSSLIVGSLFTYLGFATFGCTIITIGIGTLAVAYVPNIFKNNSNKE